ncbi:hypothetical protein LIA77_07150 [Sarocladium implicatum]|nr:hypothetical protein LIA77_07150 [Sarocladium implicatum]
MGRKPNPLILEYFVRGPKLNDNSNRYPHTCKQCGENFPKGRIDSLTTHITKKCPAISDSDRMRACLELHGLSTARAAAAERNSLMNGQINSAQAAVNALPQGWSALETLAEASRQVDLNENNRVPKGSAEEAQASIPVVEEPHHEIRFELQEPFTLDNPPINFDTAMKMDHSETSIDQHSSGLTPEERLQALVSQDAADPSDLSVAAAATARLDPSFLDPQLVPNESSEASSAEPQPDPAPPAEKTDTSTDGISTPTTTNKSPNEMQPWGEMTYMGTATLPMPMLTENPNPPMPMNRGGVRMDTGDLLLGKSRNARARFSPARRKEVQEVRKIGACIRCRILRKNCGKGTPCDTCRKVLSPRVWRTGCVRTRLHEQLDLYSAGVQVVLSQNRINMLKSQLRLHNNATVVEMSHFPEMGLNIICPTLVALLEPSEGQVAARQSKDPFHQVIMIDQDSDDIPEKVELYMRAVLPHFIEREPSKFMRKTLETAMQQLEEGEDELLSKALELWGLVESIDRERQWSILEKPGSKDEEPRLIKEVQSETDADIYTMICMQLNAAAERKANSTSRNLLSLMHRLLQDSKVKIGFNMFLTALVFLNCVEKSTWAFKAWEQDHLRPGWPLERDPGVFTQQGDNLAGLLKMLLGIRKALPSTSRSAEGKLVTDDTNPLVLNYFQSIDLDFDTIQSRQQGSQFSPADSRSLELMFCSQLLLPTQA